MRRSNEVWRVHLSADGPEQQLALEDLRRVLLRGLRGALSTHGAPDTGFLEDMAQDALLRILDRLPQFEGRSRFETWAVSVAIRMALSELRKRRWKDISLESLLDGASLGPPTETMGEPQQATRIEKRALVDAMHEVIRRDLTERQRLALHAELKGVPQDEIARYLGSNRNAIYKLTHDARKSLKRGLEAEGYRIDDVRAAFAG